MKQTAIEWLVEKMTQQDFIAIPKPEWIEQAKEMEKAEKDKQYQRGFRDGSNHIKIIYNL